MTGVCPTASGQTSTSFQRKKFPRPNEPTYALSRVPAEASEATVYSEYRCINPSDASYNRGAYIAVGCWVDSPLTPAKAVEVLDRIETIHSDLARKRNPETNAFPRDFRLDAYAAPGPAGNYRGQWTDLLCLAASGTGSRNYILTSGEIRQGAFEKLVAKTETVEAGPPPPPPPFCPRPSQ